MLYFCWTGGGLPTKTANKMNSSFYATVTTVSMSKIELIVKEIDVDWKEIEKTKSWVGADCGFVHSNMPKTKQS